MHIAALSIELRLPGCRTLKDKRSALKSLLAAIHREFNVSAAELDHLDDIHSSVIACAAVSNDPAHVQRVLGRIPGWVEDRRPDLQVIDSALSMR
ncbi:MAG TPA: DUF503 domain-containing protein [Anaerolineales bacterium]|nr:DUF503 domain-containing protein [Anaerolineales bacterium]